VTVTFADTSHHNAVDLAAYAAAGRDRIGLKATQGTTFTDPAFVDRPDGSPGRFRIAGQLGLARIVYHFAEELDSGAADANHVAAVLASLGGLRPHDVLVLDAEQVDTPAEIARADDHAREFANRAAELGYPNGWVYTYRRFAELSDLQPDDLPPGWRWLWLAQYDPAVTDAALPLPTGWDRAQLVARQFTSTAAVAGVAGPCDLSRVLRDWIVTPPREDEWMTTLFDTRAEFDAAVKADVRAVLNEGTPAGQLSWAAGNRAILANVDAIVNMEKSDAADHRAIMAAVGGVPAAVVTAVTAAGTSQWTPEQQQQTAAAVVSLLEQHGFTLDDATVQAIGAATATDFAARLAS
jgi:GH25 family lysozyme M1 (1,4-beta-N-acetylmuramidase)